LISGEIYKYIIIDAKPLSRGVCAIVRCESYVRHWKHGTTETSTLWLSALKPLPRPRGVVCDGQRGITKALTALWPDVVVQRCHSHVQRNIRVKLTLKPQSEAGLDLQWLMSQMKAVIDQQTMAEFIAIFNCLQERHHSFITEKTINNNPLVKRKWWYTHGKVRSAYGQIEKLINDDQIFAFITHPDLRLPKTTNGLEGGINSRLDELLYRHRGMTIEHQKRMVDWYLDSRTEWPYISRNYTVF
jgi:hypothetical protein